MPCAQLILIDFVKKKMWICFFLFSKKAAEISLGIYKDGCIAILMHKLTHEVEPMMVVYACIGKLLECGIRQ
jgi:hypothetical protein